MENSLLETVDCNLCGKNDYSIVYDSKYNQEKHDDLKEKFKSSGDETLIDQVVKCKSCGLIYVNPRIKSDLIIDGYSEGEDSAFASQAKGREITFGRNLSILESYLKKNKLNYPGKILDIGTANGSFLYVAKKKGWEVFGVEPNKWLCDWAKKNYDIEIKPGILSDYRFEDEFFDVVCLWDVLEHVPDPTAVLTECKRILKKGGVIVVNYPDIGSLPSKIMRRKWVFLLSVHLYYFTSQTIGKMLNKTGFDVIVNKPHFQNLELGYLVKRSKAYSNLAHYLGSKFVKLTRTEQLQIWYWVGQTLVIGKKK
jgi:ubiquinone/menaquinone biosynthesis C-methylase UbiE